MYPGERDPSLGSFVRDQVEALRHIPGLEVELFAFSPGLRSYPRAGRALRRLHAGEHFDVVHAHFGLTAWPARALRGAPLVVTLHGTDVHHPRSREITRAALPFLDFVATVSDALAGEVPRAPGHRAAVVLPCGVATDRFMPLPRQSARTALGLAADGRYLLFPADPLRREKRHDRARAVADVAGAQLLALGHVDPEEVPLWVNAANAVVVPSEREGFGLAVLEALACDVPVAATPTGVHPGALAGIAGTLCAPFDAAAWSAALAPHLAAADPRIAGRSRAQEYGSDRMAQRVLATWRELVGRR